jgi:hypothetical protein
MGGGVRRVVRRAAAVVHAGGVRHASCVYLDGRDNPQTPAFLTQRLGNDPDHLTMAFTERVENGTEAEGQERALIKGDDGLRLISALDLEPVLQLQE